MAAVINICNINLVESKTLLRFVMQTLIHSVKSFDFTGNRFNKAGFFPTSLSVRRVCREFARLGKSLASFVIYIRQLFRRKMQTLAKNLNSKTAPGASCSTANTRKRVTSTRTKSVPHYQITIDLVATKYDANGYGPRLSCYPHRTISGPL